jgi:hypothetical protein
LAGCFFVRVAMTVLREPKHCAEQVVQSPGFLPRLNRPSTPTGTRTHTRVHTPFSTTQGPHIKNSYQIYKKTRNNIATHTEFITTTKECATSAQLNRHSLPAAVQTHQPIPASSRHPPSQSTSPRLSETPMHSAHQNPPPSPSPRPPLQDAHY